MEGIIRLFSRVGIVKDRTYEEQGDKKNELLNEIKETGKQLDNARNRFDMQTNFDLVDSTIMEIDALEKRYAYLLKEAKQNKLSAF